MDPALRASDTDRERAARELELHVAAGRLSWTEFSERAAAAYQARTLGELAALRRDLPAPPREAPLTRDNTLIRWAALGAALLLVLLLGAVLFLAASGVPSAVPAWGPMTGGMCH